MILRRGLVKHGGLLQNVVISHPGPRRPRSASPGVIYTRKQGDLCCSGSCKREEAREGLRKGERHSEPSRAITREVSFSRRRCFIAGRSRVHRSSERARRKDRLRYSAILPFTALPPFVRVRPTAPMIDSWFLSARAPRSILCKMPHRRRTGRASLSLS